MGTHPFDPWSNFDAMLKKENEDLFSFSTQTEFLDFGSGYSGYAALDYEFEVPIQEAALTPFPPSMDIYPNDPLSSLTDFGPRDCMLQDVVGHEWNGSENRSEIGYEFGQCMDGMNVHVDDQNAGLVIYDGKEEMRNVEEKKVKKTEREERGNGSKKLSRSNISNYFYMPITQAAKELNIGLTLLKKRCRELGIRRWPHRKLNSLQTLIKNVQEIGNNGGHGADQEKLREAVERLEHEKKLMEEIPDRQLGDKTKRLRQACFKANYKKRRMMSVVKSQSYPSNAHASGGAATFYGGSEDEDEDEDEEEEEEEEMKPLLAGECISTYKKFHA